MGLSTMERDEAKYESVEEEGMSSAVQTRSVSGFNDGPTLARALHGQA